MSAYTEWTWSSG